MSLLALFLVGVLAGAASVLLYVLVLFAVAGKRAGGGGLAELDQPERHLLPLGNVDLLEEGGG